MKAVAACTPSSRHGLGPSIDKPMHRQRGATLLEVLVSVLIFTFGLLGLVGLQARATQYSVDAEDRNRAALLADDFAAELRLQRSTDATALITGWQARVQAPEAGLPNATLTVANPDADTATILIQWRPPRLAAAAQSSQLQTRVTLTREERGDRL